MGRLIKTLPLFGLLLFLCVSQISAQAKDKNNKSNSEKDAGDTTTVLGCIQRSGQSFVVVDSHGSSYVLHGVGDQLVGEVGHTLEVKGKLVGEAASGGEQANSGTIQVADVLSDVHRVADNCPSH